jgi:predicted pyridoxine 5'-phosphate oxidase superfamily flavin-nucleotide-binding protein
VTDTTATPFHAGEQAAQARVGVREKIAAAGQRMIRDAMPAQHRELFEKLPTIVVGSLDAQRRPWASILAGPPGFIGTPDDRTLHVAVRPDAADPLAAQLAPGAPLGLLGIEPHTRRRNRMNGTVIALDGAGFSLGVDQSFGNCPQYIQAREPQWRRAPGDAAQESSAQALGPMLNDAARRLVASADTLFIASAAAKARGHAGAQGVDVSHRGGLPGFVRLDADASGDACVLTLPDYRGNFMFNTLGNIVAHPFAGLLFVDYDSGDLLQMTGSAHIVWDGPELQTFDGAQRLLKLHIDAAWWRPAALPLRWSAPRFAPQLALAGSDSR